MLVDRKPYNASPKGGTTPVDPSSDLPTLDAYPLLRTLQGHKDGVPNIVFKPDGARIASASGDRTAKIWDLETGTAILTLSDHNGGIDGICYSKDGRFLATGCTDGILRIWDERTSSCIHQLVGHTHYVTSCCFSPGGNVIASSSFDETVRLWDVHYGKQIGVIPAHSDPVISVDFCHDPAKPMLVTGSTDGVCRIWSMHTRECCSSILPESNAPVPITSVKFTPNNKFFLISMLNSKLELWDWNAASYDQPAEKIVENIKNDKSKGIKKRKEYTGHINKSYAIQSAFLVNDPSGGKYVLSGSEDHHVYVWNLNKTKNIVGVLRGKATSNDAGNGHCDVVQGIATNMVQPMIATSAGRRDCTIKIWKHKQAS